MPDTMRVQFTGGCIHNGGNGNELARIECRVQDGEHGDCTFNFWFPATMLPQVAESFTAACEQIVYDQSPPTKMRPETLLATPEGTEERDRRSSPFKWQCGDGES